MQEQYLELSRYGKIVYTKDYITNSGYATLKLIEYKQCMHIVELLNGDVQNITILF